MAEHEKHDAAGHQASTGGDLGLSFMVVAIVVAGLSFVTAGRSNEPPPAKVTAAPAAEQAAPAAAAEHPAVAVAAVAPHEEPAATAAPEPANAPGNDMPAASAEPAPSAEAAPAPSAEAAPAPSAEAAPAPSAEAAKEAPAAGGGGEFDRLAAIKALAKSGAPAGRCRQGGAPPGEVAVVVTFAPDGTVKASRVNSAQYVGTPTGKCVLDKIGQTTIPAFSGEPQSLVTRVRVY